MTGSLIPNKLGRPNTKVTTSASRLRKEQMTSVIWTTPLGLPIVQPYRQTKRKQIATHVQSVYISDPNSPAAGAYMSISYDDDAHGTFSQHSEASVCIPAQLYPQS